MNEICSHPPVIGRRTDLETGGFEPFRLRLGRTSIGTALSLGFLLAQEGAEALDVT